MGRPYPDWRQQAIHARVEPPRVFRMPADDGLAHRAVDVARWVSLVLSGAGANARLPVWSIA
jgi:hypothetical protein